MTSDLSWRVQSSSPPSIAVAERDIGWKHFGVALATVDDAVVAAAA